MRTVGIGAKINAADDTEELKKENSKLRKAAIRSDKWLKECEAKLKEATEYAETRDGQIEELKEQVKELKEKLTETEKGK